MGWPGMIFLGAVIGWAGWWLNPLRRASRGRRNGAGSVWVAVGVGVIAAVVARMLGNIVGVYHDGDTLEWLACALFAFLAVALTLTVGVAARR